MTKDKSTPENRAYWDFVEQTAAEVRTWPAWMRGERMPDVRKMTNEGLLYGVRGCFMDHGFIRLPEELEELARRIRIMEELCEADEACRRAVDDIGFRSATEDRSRALEAYRAMKGEQNEVD